jgi:hypothetical protein
MGGRGEESYRLSGTTLSNALFGANVGRSRGLSPLDILELWTYPNVFDVEAVTL